MNILNIAGYKFVELAALAALREQLLALCRSLELKGTVLLSTEGININLAGTVATIYEFKKYLQQDTRFDDMSFHETFSSTQPFQYLKIKLKKEIITFKQPEINPVANKAPSLTPEEFKRWLDEKKDITLLDTRNDYEIRFGSFAGAMNLHLADFSELPEKLHDVDKNKPVVMFCTGGIRCEKAALLMLHQGFANVYQLRGGILGYFARVGGEHYEGECFVFDERIALNAELQNAGTIQCRVCHQPVTKAQQSLATYSEGVSCPACV